MSCAACRTASATGEFQVAGSRSSWPSSGDDDGGAAVMVEGRRAEGVDARNRPADGACQPAVAARFGGGGLDLGRQVLHRRGACLPRRRLAAERHGEQRALDLRQRQHGGEGAAGGGAEDRHHRARPHRHMQRLAALDHAHDGRPEIRPHGERHRLAGGGGERLGHRRGGLQRVRLVERGQAELQRRRAERIARRDGVLLDQAELAEAHQVGMRARRRQAGARGQVLQRGRAGLLGQRQQQPAADLDRLHRALFARLRFAVLHAASSIGPDFSKSI